MSNVSRTGARKCELSKSAGIRPDKCDAEQLQTAEVFSLTAAAETPLAPERAIALLRAIRSVVGGRLNVAAAIEAFALSAPGAVIVPGDAEVDIPPASQGDGAAAGAAAVAPLGGVALVACARRRRARQAPRR